MKELMYIRSFSKRRLPVIVGTLLLVIIGSVWLNTAPFRSGFDIADELGGNIFPSSILSVATTDAQVIVPVDSMYVGNPKTCKTKSKNCPFEESGQCVSGFKIIFAYFVWREELKYG